MNELLILNKCTLTLTFFCLGLPPVGNFVLNALFGEILSSSKKWFKERTCKVTAMSVGRVGLSPKLELSLVIRLFNWIFT